MAEEKEEAEKIWRVVDNVSTRNLENDLNWLADAGYQIFRCERNPITGTEWDIIAFNPTLLGAKHMEGMASMMNKATEQALAVAGMNPAVGVHPSASK